MAKNSFFQPVQNDKQIILREMASESVLAQVGYLNPQNGYYKGIFLDVETTDLNSKSDSIIEIAIRDFFSIQN